jgi:subfamily B ATP-binding cassette protein MsbA
MLLLSQKVEIDIATRFYKHLLSLSLKFFERRLTGELISRIKDIDEIQTAVNRVILNLSNNLFSILIFTGACLYINRFLTLIMFGFLVILGIFILLISPLLRESSYQRMERNADFFAYICESLSGIRTVKTFVAENRASRQAKRFLIRFEQSFFKEASLKQVSDETTKFLIFIANLFVFWFGGQLVIKGSLTLGSLLAFTLLFDSMMQPWEELSSLNDDFQRAFAATERFYEIFDIVPDIKDGRINLSQVKGRIEFKDVYFSYDGKENVLSEINLAILSGMTVALVGKSGAGKSTLSYLIPRFYDPTSGSVLIDGINIRDITIKSLRNQIAVVSQDPFLFSGTIRENLAFGKIGAKEEEIYYASKMANADEFILQFSKSYETRIGERGLTLSGGQRQRISIARAILKDTPILILDEATSSCDLESERLIQEALSHLIKGKTTIIIAHRLSTIKQADIIFVLDRGKIVETGNHKELIEKDGLYRHLYEDMVIL